MSSDSYRSAKFFNDKYGISSQCLRQWHGLGFVKALRLGGDRGKRTYLVSDIEKRLHDNHDDRKRIIYARVSSSKQAEDLKRQISDLQESYPDHQKVYQDIGSGVNFRRKSLSALLEQVYQGNIQEVIVMHRDRLARIGIELLEQIFDQFGVKLVVHRKSQEDKSDKHDDLIAIITLFVASHHGQRSAENRRKRKRNSIEKEIKD